MTFKDLPAVNASLNACSAILLIIGYLMIRRGQIRRHRFFMTAAMVCSAAFLASYLTYHFAVLHRSFTGQGAIRVVYFVVLISHVILAIVVTPMALVVYFRAVRGRIDSHRKLARWTLPIWLYVSATGVAVYWMLYQLDV
jgi:uncharacterized membrane protein YozB (DUF420 family)